MYSQTTSAALAGHRFRITTCDHLLLAQHAPNLLLVHIAQFGAIEAAGPARKPGRRRVVQNRQDTLTRLHALLKRPNGPRLVAQAGQTVASSCEALLGADVDVEA